MSENNNSAPSTVTNTTIPTATTTTAATPSADTSNANPPVASSVPDASAAPSNQTVTSALAELGLPPVNGEVIPPTPPVVDPNSPAPKEVAPPTITPPAPVEFEIELSENSPLSEADLDHVVELAEKYKWTKEQADNYITQREEVYRRGTNDLRTAAEKIIAEEKAKFAADPDFRGEKLKDSLTTIDEVVRKYGDNDLREYLRGPGGNSLPLSKLLLKIGNSMKQDTMIGKSVPAQQPVNSYESAMEKMYPSQFQK